MEPVKNPHDRFFKEIFSRREVSLDFVHNYAASEIARLLDHGPLQLSKTKIHFLLWPL